jgi:NTE family protein
LAEAYRDLFDRRALADLPAPAEGTPRFVFCATSIQTGACWHFHGGPAGRMGDFYTGYAPVGSVGVADAVAASSAFPPGFGAYQLRLPRDVPLTRLDPWGRLQPHSEKRPRIPGDIRGSVLLTDGGVYDNLGVEPVWKWFDGLLLSDAGKPFASVPSLKQFAPSRLKRVAEISAEQVGAVRKRWLFQELQLGLRRGAIWQINTDIGAYPAPGRRGYPPTLRTLFNGVRTDLNPFTDGEMGCLENHGYSLADAAIRSYVPHLCANPSAPFAWPYPDLCTEAAACAALARSHRRTIVRDVWRYVFRE